MKNVLRIKRHLTVYKGLPGDVYLLFAATVIGKAGSFVMPLLTLILTIKIGYTEAEAGLIATIAFAAQMPFMMLGGRLGDKIGSRKVIVLFQAAGALVYLGCSFLPPGAAMTVLIIAATCLIAVTMPATNALVAQVTPKDKVSNAYSLMYLGNNLGMAAGPAAGGLLFAAHLDWLFALSGAAMLLSAALVLLKVRGGGKPSLPVQEADNGDGGALSVFQLLRRRPYLAAFSAILLLYSFCYIQWNFLLPLQIGELYMEAGGGRFSLLFSINAWAVILLTPLLTSVTQRLAPAKSIAAGGMFYAAAFAIFAVSGSLAPFIAGIVVLTVGEILITYNSSSYIALRTPESHLSRANSLLTVVTSAGYAVGPAVMGGLLLLMTIPGAWLLVTALMAAGTACMLVFHRRDKRRIQ
jgi:MFS family permease